MKGCRFGEAGMKTDYACRHSSAMAVSNRELSDVLYAD
ncbi:hypothetical protein R2A130_2983 [Ahrensia sp. R2A130]|nr:hypothetical protein R2A130_2983 [Ahrensia sp. R2A130]